MRDDQRVSHQTIAIITVIRIWNVAVIGYDRYSVSGLPPSPRRSFPIWYCSSNISQRIYDYVKSLAVHDRCHCCQIGTTIRWVTVSMMVSRMMVSRVIRGDQIVYTWFYCDPLCTLACLSLVW